MSVLKLANSISVARAASYWYPLPTSPSVLPNLLDKRALGREAVVTLQGRKVRVPPYHSAEGRKFFEYLNFADKILTRSVTVPNPLLARSKLPLASDPSYRYVPFLSVIPLFRSQKFMNRERKRRLEVTTFT